LFPEIPLTIDDYLAQRTAAQDERWPHVQLLPGVARLVAHLTAHGVPIAIATGSVRRNYERKTKHLRDVFKHFGEHVVCGDDEGAGRGKPFPDVFLAAARTLGRSVGPNEDDGAAGVGEAERAERARGLVFEDAIPGVQAGKRAGMRVVWVPDENLLRLEGSQTTGELADETLLSLEHFAPEGWGLPPFPTNQSDTEVQTPAHTGCTCTPSLDQAITVDIYTLVRCHPYHRCGKASLALYVKKQSQVAVHPNVASAHLSGSITVRRKCSESIRSSLSPKVDTVINLFFFLNARQINRAGIRPDDTTSMS